MPRTLTCFLLVGLLLAAGLAACTAPRTPASQNQATAGPNLAATAVVKTAAAQASLSAIVPTPLPSATAVVKTLRPSSTIAPTNTPLMLLMTATLTPPPTLDPSQAGCDLVSLVRHVTIPEGFYITPGAQFTKTWRLKNAGSCTWLGADYDLVFDSGDKMDGPAAQTLQANVLPDQMIDVSVTLKAPQNAGHYRGYWKLRNALGQTFSSGGSNPGFYVDIMVGNISATLRYDFLGFFCQAEWKGDGKVLPCIGKEDDPDGFVKVQVQPHLEDGTIDDEPVLLTNPPAASDGVIQGIFPEFTVHGGDHFMSVIGCENGYTLCNVTFELNYQIDDGPIQNYAHWDSPYDLKFLPIDIDLTGLLGETVHFVLTVRSNGGTQENRAQWLKPRIIRVQPTATPVTPTPTRTPRP